MLILGSVMYLTIYLYAQFKFWAVEVKDVRPESVLLTKAEPV